MGQPQLFWATQTYREWLPNLVRNGSGVGEGLDPTNLHMHSEAATVSVLESLLWMFLRRRITIQLQSPW